MPNTCPDICSLADFGGELVDYAPVEDPTTDLSAASGNAAMAATAAMTHTSTRAWVRFGGATYSGSGTDAMTVDAHDSHWGSATGVTPTVTQTAAGAYVITWPETVTDELGESHPVALREVVNVTFSGTANPRMWTKELVSANVVKIRVFDASGSANAATGQNITVFVV